jgi:hypothetical protein
MLLAATALLVIRQSSFAAQFPQGVSAEVCGDPAIPSTVADAVSRALQTRVSGALGLDVIFDRPSCQPLGHGATATYAVHVNATAPGTFQATGAVNVTIHNVSESIGHEGLLWFCNKPENLKSEGPLFDGTLEAGKPIRMLYHHQNRGNHPLMMRIEVVNDSDIAATVLVMPGDGRPNRDPLWSGVKALRQYLPELPSGSGEVLHLAAHTAEPIAYRSLVMGDTASGICSLKLVDGGPPTVEVRAEAVNPRYDLGPKWAQAEMDTSAWHWIDPHPVIPAVHANYEIHPEVYIDPFVNQSVTAVVGGQPASVRVGVEGIPRQGGGRALNGNYAVLHTFDVTLANPSSELGHVDIVFEATSGYSSCALALDGVCTVLHPTQKGESVVYVSIPLPAGETRHIKLLAMPVSGGYYPVTLTFRPAFGSATSKPRAS